MPPTIRERLAQREVRFARVAAGDRSLGFALENFGAIGGWRGGRIREAGRRQQHRGERKRQWQGCRACARCCSSSPSSSRTVTEKLLAYARSAGGSVLRSPHGAHDRPRRRGADYRWSSRSRHRQEPRVSMGPRIRSDGGRLAAAGCRLSRSRLPAFGSSSASSCMGTAIWFHESTEMTFPPDRCRGARAAGAARLALPFLGDGPSFSREARRAKPVHRFEPLQRHGFWSPKGEGSAFEALADSSAGTVRDRTQTPQVSKPTGTTSMPAPRSFLPARRAADATKWDHRRRLDGSAPRGSSRKDARARSSRHGRARRGRVRRQSELRLHAHDPWRDAAAADGARAPCSSGSWRLRQHRPRGARARLQQHPAF